MVIVVLWEGKECGGRRVMLRVGESSRKEGNVAVEE